MAQFFFADQTVAQTAEIEVGKLHAYAADNYFMKMKASDSYKPKDVQTFVNSNIDWCTTGNPPIEYFMCMSIKQTALKDSKYNEAYFYINKKCIDPDDLKIEPKKGQPMTFKQVNPKLLSKSGNRYYNAYKLLKSIKHQHLPKKGGSTTTILPDGRIVRIHNLKDTNGDRHVSICSFSYLPYRPPGEE